MHQETSRRARAIVLLLARALSLTRLDATILLPLWFVAVPEMLLSSSAAEAAPNRKATTPRLTLVRRTLATVRTTAILVRGMVSAPGYTTLVTRLTVRGTVR